MKCLNQRHEKKDKFNRIYDHYVALIFKISMKFLKDEEKAKDAVQECFIRIYKNLGLFHDVESSATRSLIYIMAKNIAIDFYRCQRKVNQMEYMMEVSVLDAQMSTDMTMMKDEVDSLRKYTSQMEPLEESMVVLHYYYKFTYREIGRILGISENTVKVRMFRIRRKIRKEGRP